MSDMDKETLEIVLEDFTSEQKLTNQNINDLTTAVNTNTGKLEEIKKEISNPQAPAISEGDAFGKMALKEVVRLRQQLERQQQSIVRKFQILLFPEQDAKTFYRIVFGRWLLYLCIMLAINRIYLWGVHHSDNLKAVQVEQLENDRILKSWNYLYNNSGRETKRKMEKAYKESGAVRGQ
ncbi:hypothetical protein GCM10009120_07740 [Sphingobacterium siyangense subsp. cladoniae]|uniref:hypothetical protein n=1 Tax=Sphingobacterium siyangense TaxID=459529 RepID=UPI0031F8B89F